MKIGSLLLPLCFVLSFPARSLAQEFYEVEKIVTGLFNLSSATVSKLASVLAVE